LVLEELGCPESEVSVLLCTDAAIQKLNAQWRGKDAATDVLSFSQVEDAQVPFPGEAPTLGDVVISIERAEVQANELGHSVAQEVRCLLVHGVLHLLGHDHEGSEEDAARMRTEEERLLNALMDSGLGSSTAGLVLRAARQDD
jgi:probable rRNA maturation factor